MKKELEENKVVLSEGIQTMMRKYSMGNAYEKLKELTRTNNNVCDTMLQQFIDTLPENIRNELKNVSIQNYTGYSGM